MTLREELIKLALSFLGITLLGGAFTAFWTSLQRRREIEEMELKSFYDNYGRLLTACRLWNAAKSKKIPFPNEAARYQLLKQASEAESVLEGMLLKLASERTLNPDQQSRLGRFRQGYQSVRQAIRDDREGLWTSSQADSYLDFKEGAALFASLLKKHIWMRAPTQESARQAVCEITHNRHEPLNSVCKPPLRGDRASSRASEEAVEVPNPPPPRAEPQKTAGRSSAIAADRTAPSQVVRASRPLKGPSIPGGNQTG
jgi:hypothetical protein